MIHINVPVGQNIFKHVKKREINIPFIFGLNKLPAFLFDF